ncbi:hypothetical protein SACE_0744 [Saccharopolyspora erythraea NRRL 2338]|uniref:Uncharacterized protein n=1 Tax=Saccharopolyspora erythraea (strain ATCC 11635 / DSM 40517 / JCM 4748 / NBRC 13426 / NCIMB 8594 / NRRL 2338) TaxID=405948 RepID=A4F7R1_SACEN|nr:hypothetical protein SACE_0744 [Saccharopolyspora erythraea NRRL 2338]
MTTLACCALPGPAESCTLRRTFVSNDTLHSETRRPPPPSPGRVPSYRGRCSSSAVPCPTRQGRPLRGRSAETELPDATRSRRTRTRSTSWSKREANRGSGRDAYRRSRCLPDRFKRTVLGTRRAVPGLPVPTGMPTCRDVGVAWLWSCSSRSSKCPKGSAVTGF